ncbi:MAG: AraC family transcriptional regulator [Alphaproteobacteria bacterium]|nr:AraC family transcriptional regulator [Alphaproteobacteria bacterium]
MVRTQRAGSSHVVYPRIRAVAAQGLEDVVARLRGDFGRVRAHAGLSPADLSQPQQQIDLAAYCALLEQAAQETRQSATGLLFAQQHYHTILGDVGALALNSPTVGAALTAVSRYFPALQEHSRIVLRQRAGMAILEYQVQDGRIIRRSQDAELTIGIMLQMMRRALGIGWTPQQVLLEHAPHADGTQHRAFLGAPIHFLQRTNAIVFPAAALAAPMPAPDVALLPLLEQRVTRPMQMSQPDDFVGAVQQEIRTGLLSGKSGLKTTARRLAMAPSTMYRRLRERNVEYSALTRGLRFELALMHLAQPHVPVTDIALLLGYSELSAFSRAFSRWAGVSPGAYRRSLVCPSRPHRNPAPESSHPC